MMIKSSWQYPGLGWLQWCREQPAQGWAELGGRPVPAWWQQCHRQHRLQHQNIFFMFLTIKFSSAFWTLTISNGFQLVKLSCLDSFLVFISPKNDWPLTNYDCDWLFKSHMLLILARHWLVDQSQLCRATAGDHTNTGSRENREKQSSSLHHDKIVILLHSPFRFWYRASRGLDNCFILSRILQRINLEWPC